MTSQETKTMFHDFMNEQIKVEEIKVKKPYTVRVQLGMIIECAVTATSEEEAEEMAECLVEGHFYNGAVGACGLEIGANETDMTIKSYGVNATGDTIEEDDE